jgi:hypothetical protein
MPRDSAWKEHWQRHPSEQEAKRRFKRRLWRWVWLPLLILVAALSFAFNVFELLA